MDSQPVRRSRRRSAANTAPAGTPATPDVTLKGEMYHRMGTLTRQLHNVLSELGYAQRLHNTVEALPDTRSRLNYIERLSGDAAEKVLARVELAKDEQAEIVLATRRFVTQQLREPSEAARAEAAERFAHLVEERSLRIDGHLTEIMLAQDFHDLTGQVISRVIETAAMLEEQLVQLLLMQSGQDAERASAAASDAMPRRGPAGPTGPVGPAIAPDGKSEMQNQKQVDDLLSSLGF